MKKLTILLFLTILPSFVSAQFHEAIAKKVKVVTASDTSDVPKTWGCIYFCTSDTSFYIGNGSALVSIGGASTGTDISGLVNKADSTGTGADSYASRSALVDTASNHWTRTATKLNKADSAGTGTDSYATRTAIVDTSGDLRTAITNKSDYTDDEALNSISLLSGAGYMEKTSDNITLGDSVFSSKYQENHYWDSVEPLNSDTAMFFQSDSLQFFDITDPDNISIVKQIEVSDYYEQRAITKMGSSDLVVLARKVNDRLALTMYDASNPATMTDWGREDSLDCWYHSTLLVSETYLFSLGDYAVLGTQGENQDSLKVYTFEVNKTTKQFVGAVDSLGIHGRPDPNIGSRIAQLADKEHFALYVDYAWEGMRIFKVDSTNGAIASTDTVELGDYIDYDQPLHMTSRGNRLAAFGVGENDKLVGMLFEVNDGVVEDTLSVDTLSTVYGNCALRGAHYYGKNKIAVRAKLSSHDERAYLINYPSTGATITDSLFVNADYDATPRTSSSFITPDSSKLFVHHIQDESEHEYKAFSIAEGDWSLNTDYLAEISDSTSIKLNKADSTGTGADSYSTRTALVDTASAHWTEINSISTEAADIENISTGIINSYYYFDGDDDFIDVGETFQNTFRSSFSISLWVKPEDGQPDSDEEYFYGVTSSNSTIQMYLGTSGELRMYMGDGTTILTSTTSTGVFSDGEVAWHYITFTADYVNDEYKIYVNNEELTWATEGNFASLSMSNYTSSSNLYIGARNSGGNSFDEYNGGIAQFRIENRAMTSAEIVNRYNSGLIKHKYYEASSDIVTTYDTSGTQDTDITLIDKYEYFWTKGNADSLMLGATKATSDTTFLYQGSTVRVNGGGAGDLTGSNLQHIGNVLDLNKSKTDSVWYDDSGNEIAGTIDGVIRIPQREAIQAERLIGETIEIDGKITTSGDYSGTTSEQTAGATVAFADALYVDSDGELKEADADGAATMPVLWLAAEAGTDGNTFTVIEPNSYVVNSGWSFTAGDTIYVSTTAGDLTSTAPSGIGDLVQVVGYAMSATKIKFLPSPEATEVE